MCGCVVCVDTIGCARLGPLEHELVEHLLAQRGVGAHDVLHVGEGDGDDRERLGPRGVEAHGQVGRELLRVRPDIQLGERGLPVELPVRAAPEDPLCFGDEQRRAQCGCDLECLVGGAQEAGCALWNM